MFDKRLTTDERIDALADLMVDKFSELKTDITRIDEKLNEHDSCFQVIENKLDKIEFNTSGQERRISTLEDKVRIISTKIGLA